MLTTFGAVVRTVRRLVLRAVCRHDYVWQLTYHGDEIIEHGWKRSGWKCWKCGRWEDRDALYPQNK